MNESETSLISEKNNYRKKKSVNEKEAQCRILEK